MNVILLYPEFPDTFLSFKHALAFAGKRAALPPLGLLNAIALAIYGYHFRKICEKHVS